MNEFGDRSLQPKKDVEMVVHYEDSAGRKRCKGGAHLKASQAYPRRFFARISNGLFLKRFPTSDILWVSGFPTFVFSEPKVWPSASQSENQVCQAASSSSTQAPASGKKDIQPSRLLSERE